MKTQLAIAVLTAALITPALWANDAASSGMSAPETHGSDSSATKAHKKHHKSTHHKKTKKAETTSSASEPAAAPTAQ